MDDTPDNNDDNEVNSEANLNSLTENNSLNNDENGVFQQEITDVEHIRNEAIYKIREREPARVVLLLLLFFSEHHRGL
jgi:hypothetical protein